MPIHPIFEGVIAAARGQANAYAAEGEAARLRKIISAMLGCLVECENYFEERQDVVDGSYGDVMPNAEMNLYSECKEVIAKAEAALKTEGR
jgi:hypothetical protein